MYCPIKPNQFQNLLLDIEGEGIIETFNHFDVFISDFNEKTISNDVAEYLDVRYLSKATWPPTFPVFGKLTNISYRRMIFLSNRQYCYKNRLYSRLCESTVCQLSCSLQGE